MLSLLGVGIGRFLLAILASREGGLEGFESAVFLVFGG